MKSNKMFYIFISYNSKILEHYNELSSIMSKLEYSYYAIFYGGCKKNIFNKHVIHIDCDDTYEGLPNKIHNICKYIKSNPIFKQFSYFCKIDATSPIKSLISNLGCDDYYGIIAGEWCFNRSNHFGKCSKDSPWNCKMYNGKFTPYCLGGCYVFSKKALKAISETPNDCEHDIYEDLYVGQTLNKHNIHPTGLYTKDYLIRW